MSRRDWPPRILEPSQAKALNVTLPFVWINVQQCDRPTVHRPDNRRIDKNFNLIFIWPVLVWPKLRHGHGQWTQRVLWWCGLFANVRLTFCYDNTAAQTMLTMMSMTLRTWLLCEEDVNEAPSPHRPPESENPLGHYPFFRWGPEKLFLKLLCVRHFSSWK